MDFLQCYFFKRTNLAGLYSSRGIPGKRIWLKLQQSIFWVYFCIALGFSSCATIGKVTHSEHEFGTYQLYVPQNHSTESKVVVVVHGTPNAGEDVTDVARTFIDRWVDFAEATGAVIIAPAFDQENFASHSGAFGGYRGLYGRIVGADEFVHHILDQVVLITPVANANRFFLYGHSAGGQFVSRYVVRHPERVLGAVLSAPGRYAFPDETESWHFGMESLQREIYWEVAGETQQINITPDPEGWVEAAALPMMVIVGDQDLDQLSCIPAQCDPSQETATRIQIGERWVEEMAALAAENGRKGRINFKLVPDVGHSSAGLTDAAQEALIPYFTPTVPELIGMHELEAMEALQEVSLRGKVAQRRLSGRPKGEVIFQTPSARTVVTRDSQVILHVSFGEREPSDRNRIPDVVGMNEAQATIALRAEGFTTRLTFADSDRPFGEVIAQRPEAGELVKPESEVHLIASLGKGPR
jgi:pimeloyl-ACP methyl ester carboxylesterase